VSDSAPDSLELLIGIQASVLEYRRIAASGRYDKQTSRKILQLADEVEKQARKLDAAGRM
jgi:hypothetical protein